MKKQNNIESVFQEAFKNYEVDPGTNAWSNIQSKMNATPDASQIANNASGSIGGGVSSSLITAIVTVVTSAAIIGGYFYFNQDDQLSKADNGKIENSTSIEQDLKEKPAETILDAKETSDNVQQKTENTESINDKSSKLESEQLRETSKPGIDLHASKDKVTIVSEEKTEQDPIDELLQSGNSNSETSTKGKDVVDRDNYSSAADGEGQNPNQPVSDAQDQQVVIDGTVMEFTDDDPSESSPDLNEKTTNQDSPEEARVRARLKEILDGVQKYLTPNLDGHHDIFQIKIENPEDVDRISVQVLNIGGKELHKWNEIYGYWDGLMPDGSIAENGSYPYIIVLEKGNVSEFKRAFIFLRR